MDSAQFKTINVSSYNDIAEIWHSVRKNRVVDLCIQEFAALIPDGGKILDVGCGTGHPVDEYLLSRGFYITGIDPSEKMLEKTEDLVSDRSCFIKSDFLDFDTDLQYDALLAFDCLWYIASVDQPLIYKKAAALLKKGGLFMFTHGKIHGEVKDEMFNAPFLYTALSVDEVKNLLNENGFDILRLETDYKEPSTGMRDLLIVAEKI